MAEDSSGAASTEAGTQQKLASSWQAGSMGEAAMASLDALAGAGRAAGGATPLRGRELFSQKVLSVDWVAALTGQ